MRHRIHAALALVAALIVSGCTDEPAPEAGESFTVPYAGAASRLAGLDRRETTAQLLDWARTGLAAQLELDTGRVRDAAYDTLPVRDPGFSDLSRQSTGPGRALFDGNVLHLLVAPDDPHRSRTIGQLLDQHRTDSGSDPQQVRLHNYVVNTDAQTIVITSESAVSAGDARSAHGYVSKQVNDAGALKGFLGQTRYLSHLEVRGQEIWAEGWNWPDGPGLTEQDVSVLQRGYAKPKSEPRPGFSLDPGPTETVADVQAVLPGLDPALAAGPITGDWAGVSPDDLAAVAEAVLHGDSVSAAELADAGLPSDRAQLWAILGAIGGQPIYSQARYDGGLAGTEIGMTLFYTDFVAKDWANGVGTGVPAKAVEGFVPDSEAVTPWSHCSTASDGANESGRLWFGQNESAFSFDDKQIRIGAQSTRLFARSDGESGGEVEPSFAFGRGLRWWDQNYQAVADYEPQYQRLDQIMRWSGALEWLTSKTSVKLPQLNDSDIRSDLRFADWYAGKSELKERSKVQFVDPPSAEQESVVPTPSKSFEGCGYKWISGGVSLGDVITRMGERSYRADLPGPANRAGLFDESSKLQSDGTGSISRKAIDSSGKVVDSQKHTFSTVDGRARVELSATGRRVVQLGGLKILLPESAPREIVTEIQAGQGKVSQRFSYKGRDFGELTAVKDKDNRQVSVQWRRGLVDRARTVLESIQNRMAAKPAEGVPSAKDGVHYTLTDNGQTVHRISGGEEGWLAISGDLPPPADALAFRLGSPKPAGGPQFSTGTLAGRPNGPPGGWLDVGPATADRAATAVFTTQPGTDAATVQVSTRDGRKSTAYVVGDHVRVPLDDPLLGVSAPAEGSALLGGFTRVTAAMKEAAQQKDGAQRVVRLGDDGAALVSDNSVQLLSSNGPWGARVLALVDNEASRAFLARTNGDQLILIDRSELNSKSGTQRQELGQVLDSTNDPYLHESFRSRLGLQDGRVVRAALPRDTQVRVREYQLKQAIPQRSEWADIRSHGGAEWLRIGGMGPRVNPNQSPAPSAAPQNGQNGQNGQNAKPDVRILLVCPDTDEREPGCED